MQLQTLIYNSTGELLSCVDGIRGAIIVDRNRAIALQYHDTVLRSSTMILQIPAQIVLTYYVKYNYTKGAPFSRENVYLRDNFHCQYCNTKHSFGDLTLDHVIPKSKGGVLDWDNAATACKPCNSFKEDRTPKEAGMTLINIPYRPTIKKLRKLKQKAAR